MEEVKSREKHPNCVLGSRTGGLSKRGRLWSFEAYVPKRSKRTTSCECVQYTTLHCIPLDKLRAMVEIEAGRIVVGQTWSYEEAGNLRTRGLGYREEGMTDRVPARCSRAPFTSN